MGLNINALVVECVKQNSGTKLTANEIAQWIFERYRSDCEEKRRRSKQNLTKDIDLVQQIGAEIAANRPVIQRKNHTVRTTETRPIRYYYGTEFEYAEVIKTENPVVENKTARRNHVISLEQFESQWLEEIVANNPSTTQLGHRFAEKILRDWHEIDDATAEIILCDGAGDGGIDAAVFMAEDLNEGIEGDTWILVQSKYGSSFSGAETISAEAQKLFATLEGKREKLSSLSAELVQRLRNFLANRGTKDRLDYVMATTNRLTTEEEEYLANIKTLGRAKFGDCFDVDSVSVETIYNKVAEEDAFGVNKLEVTLKTIVASSGNILLVGATRLTDVFQFMQDYKVKSGDLDLLYEKNVRKFLGNKRKVNKGIEATIENHPERFGLYNNGITIVAEEVTKVSTDELILVNPFIVNGCQTTRSIWSVLQRKLNSGGTAPSDAQREWQSRLNTAVVITKIVVVGTEGEELPVIVKVVETFS